MFTCDMKSEGARLARQIPMPERVKPFVGDDGIYIPSSVDCRAHQCIITKEMFIEAYNKWIREAKRPKRRPIYFGEDTAEEWCE